jgi:hypothetical protein
LKTHSSAFDGLLSLIPAKYYYDNATQDQWQQKKKDNDELKQNKRAKLDPNVKSGADEYHNSSVTAKDVMDNKAMNGKKVVLPGSKFKKIVQQENTDSDEQETKKSESENVEPEKSDSDDSLIHDNSQMIFDDDGNEVAHKEKKPLKDRKVLSPELQKQKEENLTKLREKLAARITNLKERRKAPGTKSGGAVKSRQQILEERKKKEELKRKRKKEQQDVDESDSDSDGENEEQPEESSNEDKSVLFGNIVFNDGSRVTSDLTKLRNTADKKKQKGPANNDIKAHLNKIEKKKRKLEQMSTDDQKKEQEKSNWQKVLAQAEGIKVKDDEKLLKKALKRKEKQKLKSEIEWRDRKQIVKDTISARLKRREENLKARKENKGKKSKHQPKLRKFTGIVNKTAKKRAGFEGSAKSKSKRK